MFFVLRNGVVKTIKRFFSVVITISLCISFAACNSKSTDSSNSSELSDVSNLLDLTDETENNYDNAVSEDSSKNSTEVSSANTDGNSSEEAGKEKMVYMTATRIKLYGEYDIPYYLDEYSKQSVPQGDGTNATSDNQPTITPFLAGSKGCIILIPGGGYSARGDYSFTCMANTFKSMGITTFLLRYRIGNGDEPDNGYNLDAILSDGQRAVQFVRYYADEFGIDPNQIAVLGFSAGGHLAGMISQNKADENIVGDEIGNTDSLPNATVLMYPCITLGNGAFYSLLPILSADGLDNQDEIISKYSLEKNVTSDLAPTFIMYGTADTYVNYQLNSVPYIGALKNAGVIYETYEREGFQHGQELGSQEVLEWHNRVKNFLINNGFSL